ncbi:MAG TPA: DegT/DnrJ/EryC1/StrS family aminotransferase [Mycobacteriales bacterium]|nr:DegT/DnrJ/EryC1/StrS family aminotransferase [Mycobacteriales bacterium]
MSPSRRYPVAQPSLTDLEERYVLEAVRSGWVSSSGAFVDRFEREFAERTGSGHALVTANGTVALHLALAALGIGPGDEVVIPALTYIATANAVTYCGATVVLADVSPDTWCLDAAAVEKAITRRTRAVIAVDVYGQPADYAALADVCDAHGLLLVADAAESVGADVAGAPVGSLAPVTTFSFFGNKVMTAGEGGCVTTSDPELAARMRLLRGQGMDPERRYYFPVVGFNYRLTNVAAALLCAQFERLDGMIARRDAVVAGYESAFAGDLRLTPQPLVAGTRRAPWLAAFLVGEPGDGRSRDALMAELSGAGVETRPFFIPLHHLPPYRGDGAQSFPVTEDLGYRGINLPTYADLTDEDVTEIARRVRESLDRI